MYVRAWLLLRACLVDTRSELGEHGECAAQGTSAPRDLRGSYLGDSGSDQRVSVSSRFACWASRACQRA